MSCHSELLRYRLLLSEGGIYLVGLDKEAGTCGCDTLLTRELPHQ